jgi:RNA polymerase sigma factor (sigma-70 family)
VSRTYLAYESMRTAPVGVNRFGQSRWKKPVLKLAEYWGTIPEVLFPEAIQRIEKAQATQLLSAVEMNQHMLSEHSTQLMLMAPDTRINQEELGLTVQKVLQYLSPREERIVKRRFGLVDGEEETLQEIGDDEGVTRERVRSIEVKALRKLRHPGRCGALRMFMEE